MIVRLLSLAIILFSFLSRLQAQSCDEIVLDPTGRLNTFSVIAAAKDIAALGPDIRIHVVDSFYQLQTADKYKATLQTTCPLWFLGDGQIGSNFVVLVVSLKEASANIYVGERWRGQLENQKKRIETDEMKFRLERGLLTPAVLSGLQAIASLLKSNSKEELPASISLTELAAMEKARRQDLRKRVGQETPLLTNIRQEQRKKE